MENHPLVIIIDDNTNILALFKEVLEMNGYQVKTFEDFYSALMYYKENQKEIKVVLLDMIQPNTDYRITIPALLAVNPEVNIICMSGSVDTRDLHEQVRDKIKYFLKKPFPIETILTELRKLI